MMAEFLIGSLIGICACRVGGRRASSSSRIGANGGEANENDAPWTGDWGGPQVIQKSAPPAERAGESDDDLVAVLDALELGNVLH